MLEHVFSSTNRLQRIYFFWVFRYRFWYKGVTGIGQISNHACDLRQFLKIHSEFKLSLNFEIENLSWFRKSGRSVWNTLMTLVKFINLSRKTRFCFLLQHFKVFKTFPAPPLRRNWRGRSVRITILMISKL